MRCIVKHDHVPRLNLHAIESQSACVDIWADERLTATDLIVAKLL